MVINKKLKGEYKNMDFNLRCDNFKKNLIKLIDDSELPIAVIYYICQNIFSQVQKSYFGTINQAILKEQQENLQQIQNQIQEKTSQLSKDKKED